MSEINVNFRKKDKRAENGDEYLALKSEDNLSTRQRRARCTPVGHAMGPSPLAAAGHTGTRGGWEALPWLLPLLSEASCPPRTAPPAHRLPPASSQPFLHVLYGNFSLNYFLRRGSADGAGRAEQDPKGSVIHCSLHGLLSGAQPGQR